MHIRKKLVIFGAEYLVVGEGILFLLPIVSKTNAQDALFFLASGVFLMICSLGSAHFLKRLFHIVRPPRDRQLFTPGDTYSFPSKHATVLFSLVIFTFTENHFYGVIALVIALIIVACRVIASVHRSIDILAGIVLGSIIAIMVIEYVPGLFSFINDVERENRKSTLFLFRAEELKRIQIPRSLLRYARA